MCSNISNERPDGWARWYRTCKHRKPNSRDSTEISGLWDYQWTLFPNLGCINHAHRPPGRVDTHPAARSIVLFLIRSSVWISGRSFFIVFAQRQLRRRNTCYERFTVLRDTQNVFLARLMPFLTIPEGGWHVCPKKSSRMSPLFYRNEFTRGIIMKRK